MLKCSERKEYLSYGTQRGMVIGWKPFREVGREVHPGADSVNGRCPLAEYAGTRYVHE